MAAGLWPALIKRVAHVRGPVPGFSIRTRGRRLNAAPVQEKNARARRGLLKKPSPPSLGGHSRLPARSSAERCPLGTSAPQRGRRGLAPPSGAATSRWDVAQRPVSAAASVGDGRSPLGCITRGGSRDAGTAAAVTERPTHPLPRTCVFLLHRRGVQPPVSPAGSVGPERSPLGTRTPGRELTAEAPLPAAVVSHLKQGADVR